MKAIVFHFLDGLYGVELEKVKGILVYEQVVISPLFNEKKWVKGMINLRGEVTPIIDLRVRFGESEPDFSKDSVIAIIKTNQNKLIGIIIDRVYSIMELDEDNLSTVPDISVGIEPKYIHSLIKINEIEMITVLNIDKILDIGEIS
ncbi:MAG: chemotaxis protein CheW [Campylobacterales bacterium]|nr:chemotaxis protein CheW [Campylobacterales bacterium]